MSNLRDAVETARARRPRGCPLQVRANGQWAVKRKGRIHTFGSVLEVSVTDAMARYHQWAADLAAGREPTPIDAGSVTIGEVFEAFVQRQLKRVDRGAVTANLVAGQARYLRWAGEQLGGRTPISDLSSGTFSRLMDAAEATGWSPTTTANMVNAVRGCFLWAHDEELIDRLPRYGRRFRKPSRSSVRRFRAGRGRQGRVLLEAEEIRRLIDLADPLLRAAILLGISCGFGQSDVSALPEDALDLEAGWIRWPRPKSGITRRCPIWPETAQAIAAWREWEHGGQVSRSREAAGTVLASRRGLLLVSRGMRIDGKGTVRQRDRDLVGRAFIRLLVEAGIRRQVDDESRALTAKGIGFYCLRHTFATIADRAGDRLAVSVVMGHITDGSQADEYVERVDDDRLHAVSHGVRSWLLGESAQGGSSERSDAEPEPASASPAATP